MASACLETPLRGQCAVPRAPSAGWSQVQAPERASALGRHRSAKVRKHAAERVAARRACELTDPAVRLTPHVGPCDGWQHPAHVPLARSPWSRMCVSGP